MAEGETWVWADGTIYDPAIPGYRQATADELRRNVPGGPGGLTSTTDDDYVITYATVNPDDPIAHGLRWRAERDELRGLIAEALAALGAKDATNYERVQAAGLILSRPCSTSSPSAPNPESGPNQSRRDTTDSARRPGEKVFERPQP